MSLVLDLIVLAVTVLLVILAAKKGFARTLIETLGMLVSIVASHYLCVKLADWLYPILTGTPADGSSGTVNVVTYYILTFIIFLIIFGVFSFIIAKIGKSVNSMFEESAIGPVNTVLGAGVGLIKAALVFVILTALLALYLRMSSSHTAELIQSGVERSVLMSRIFKYNPLIHLSVSSLLG